MPIMKNNLQSKPLQNTHSAQSLSIRESMRFVDSYFYCPNFFQKCLSFCLLPISLLYLVLSILRRKFSWFEDLNIPIISVGNLIAGGSGKTPFILSIARDFKHPAIITRGYKRSSKGLIIVSIQGRIQTSQEEAGDEPYLMAKELKNATVIACKNRKIAIFKAKELGANCIFLDDGFRFKFKKLNILLKPKFEPHFKFCLPSGIYRERPGLYKTADILIQEDKDYIRKVDLKNPTSRMILLTAIANPIRLNSYIPKVIHQIHLPDHSKFCIPKLKAILKEKQGTSFLVTQKDAIKLQTSELPLSILELDLQLNPRIRSIIHEYVNSQSYPKG